MTWRGGPGRFVDMQYIVRHKYMALVLFLVHEVGTYNKESITQLIFFLAKKSTFQPLILWKSAGLKQVPRPEGGGQASPDAAGLLARIGPSIR